MRSKELVVAYAVHETGRREVIGIDLGEVETEAFWIEFLRGRPHHTSFRSSAAATEQGSIILTTNRGIAEWGEIFEDTTVAAAVLDRLLHHCTVVSINGTQAHIA